MQIPAIFGHQAYAANTVYEVYPDVGQRLAWQRLLANATWDSEIVEIARDQGGHISSSIKTRRTRRGFH